MLTCFTPADTRESKTDPDAQITAVESKIVERTTRIAKEVLSRLVIAPISIYFGFPLYIRRRVP
jgi:hypothetical protein